MPGGRDFVYAKQLDRARRNLKPTSTPIFFSGRSRLNPFLDACDAILCSGTCSSASHSLVGWSTLRPRLTRHPASPRPHAANEENAALRKAIEDADYEYGVGLLRLNQLDLVTVVASPATVPKKRNCAFTRSNSPFHLDFLKVFASPMQVTRRSNRGFSTVRLSSTGRLWILDNDSLEVTTSTRSPMRSSRRDGRFACGARARRLDAVLDLRHQRQALLNKSIHHGTAPATVCRRRNEHGKIGSPPSLHRAPERSVRCAIAHF